MLRLTVRRRIILLLLLVSVVPLVVANTIWLLSSQAQLRKDAAAQQTLQVENAANSVEYYINNKVNAAIIHSKSAAVQYMQLPAAKTELSAYLKEDSDLTQIALIDASGTQRLLVTHSGISTTPVNVSSSAAFRVVTFLGGEEYISPVSFNAQHNGSVTISVPLTNYVSTTGGSYLSTSESGVILQPAAIKGALVVTANLHQLWSSVLNFKLGQSGYVYVVDNQGRLVAYPNTGFGTNHTDLANVQAVKSALAQATTPGATDPQPTPSETISETGVPVLSSHYRVDRTGWIVVAEEPISSVYAPVTNDERIAAIFFSLSFLVGVMLILLTARSLVSPIRTLTDGANRLASGDLDYRISLPRSDEFGLLAKTFNNMASKISADITKLENLDKLKNEFIVLVSHNLRTPLSVISGYIGIIRESEISEKNREMIVAMEKGTRQLSNFSDDLLAIASIEAGSAKLQLTDIAAGELLKPLEPEFNAKAAEKGIHLTWSDSTPEAMLSLSPVHIRSAISNLIKNALEFTPQGGEVEIVLTSDTDIVLISVRDNGCGIAPDEVKRLFTKFHRGTNTMRFDHPGTGIGLYFTLLIVEAHRGHITVRSRLGHGSTFTVVLPLRQPLEQAAHDRNASV